MKPRTTQTFALKSHSSFVWSVWFVVIDLVFIRGSL